MEAIWASKQCSPFHVRVPKFWRSFRGNPGFFFAHCLALCTDPLPGLRHVRLPLRIRAAWSKRQRTVVEALRQDFRLACSAWPARTEATISKIITVTILIIVTILVGTVEIKIIGIILF